MSDAIRITNTRPEHASQIYDVGRLGYGLSLDEDCWDCIHPADVENHLRLFPEGQFVALEGQRVVGYACTLLVSHPPEETARSWFETVGDLGFNNHDPEGTWLYGGDFVVLPAHRRQGIGTRLYQARFDLVRRLNLRGFYAGAMLMGYGAYSGRMSLEAYVEAIRNRQIYDPTVSMQLNRGFELGRLIEGYTEHKETNDTSILIIWRNPDYQPPISTSTCR